jgi:quercetin dioxygenase-like cupin family protein
MMELVNAIGKVRFGSAKPQVVRLHKGKELTLELLCMEPGQEFKCPTDERAYYVITGAGRMSLDRGAAQNLPAGQLAVTAGGQSHILSNPAEQRLICLVIRGAS